MPNKPEFTINFQPIGKRVNTVSNQSLLNVAQEAGIAIASICGGVGICDSCKVHLIKGRLTEQTLEEKALFSESELNSGFRLACQSYPLSDLTIEIPPESLTAPQRLQIEGQAQSVKLDPPVCPIEVRISEPSSTDLRADSTRVMDSLMENGMQQPITYSYPVLETMSPDLRRYQWHTTLAMRNNSVVAVLPASVSLVGLAIDVGTTKLAAYLCDLTTGAILANAGATKPRSAFGDA